MEPVVQQGPHALALLVAVLLVLAAKHKILVVARGEAAREPLIGGIGVEGRIVAAILLVVATALELATAVALLVFPLVGYFLAAGLIGFYAGALRRLPGSQPCACFGEGILPLTRSGAIARNFILSVLTFGLGIAVLVGRISEAWQVIPASEAGLLLVAPIVAGQVLSRANRSESDITPFPGPRWPHLLGGSSDVAGK